MSKRNSFRQFLLLSEALYGKFRGTDLAGGLHPSGPDHLPVPAERILRKPLTGGEIHINQTETVTIAAVPFQIVRQGPMEIAPDIGSAFHGLV